MAQLTFSYDTTTKKFSAASVDGRPLDGVSRVTLGVFTVEVMDRQGRDLLGAAESADERTQSSVSRDIAACFGADIPTPSNTASDDQIDRWDFSQWSSK